MIFLHRIRDSTQLVDAFNVDPVYLKHANQGKVPDYRVTVHNSSITVFSILIFLGNLWVS